MRTAVISNINELKRRSVGPLKDQQIAYVPRYADDMIESQVTEYLMEGKRTLINQKKQTCFRLRYLQLNYMTPREYMDFNRNVHPMTYAVSSGRVKPFMLFINGKFVKWSMIQIVATQESNYLIITSNNEEWIHAFHYTDEVNVIMLPEYTKYIEAPVMPDTIIDEYGYGPMFTFDETGVHNYEAPTVSVVSTLGKLICTDYEMPSPVDALIVDSDATHKYYPENVIVFDKYGLLYRNPGIEMTSTMLSIEGSEDRGENLFFKVFYSTRANKSAEVISKVSTDYIKPVEQAKNDGTEYPEYMEQLVTPFSVKMSRLKEYETNFLEAIQYILSYDPVLFRNAFLANSNMRIEEMSGLEVNLMKDELGLLSLPRQHNMDTDEFMIILVNGQMYKFFHFCKIFTNKFQVPIQNIDDTDVVEFMYFTNVNNNTYDFTLSDTDDEYHNYDLKIFNDGMVLMSTYPPQDSPYTYPVDGLQHFPVEYAIHTNEHGHIKVELLDPYYYNKPLKIVYRNQFRHFWYTLSEDNIEDNEYSINLGSRFMYCIDYNKYMVFHNGRRLTSDQFRLTLPVRAGTPFYDFKIYLTIPFSRGDVIDIFYLPSLMRDVNVDQNLPQSGDIVIDKSVLGYPLSNDLYILWINGKKIPNSAMADIDSTRLKVIVDQESLKTVGLTKFIEDDDILTPIFQETPALWDAIVAHFQDDVELCSLLGITPDTLTDTEDDVYEGSIPVTSIMWELIREEFAANPHVDPTKPFVYDYLDVDSTAVEGYDSDGNALLPIADANRTDNIVEIDRPWP